MVKCNLKTVRNHVAKMEEFNCNNTLIGKWTDEVNFGWIDGGEAGVSLANQLSKSAVHFVIYSYDTPIAVYNTFGGWWKNPNKYTVTTSRHQSAIRL